MIVIAAIAKSILENKARKITQKFWMKPWLHRRSQHGVFNFLLQGIKLEDQKDYKKLLQNFTKCF